MRIKMFLMALVFAAVTIFGGMSIVDLQPKTTIVEAGHDWNKFNRSRRHNRRRQYRPRRRSRSRSRRQHHHPGCFIGALQSNPVFNGVDVLQRNTASNLTKRVKEVPDWNILESDKEVYAYTSRKTRRERRHIRKMYRLSRRRGGGGGCFIDTIQQY